MNKILTVFYFVNLCFVFTNAFSQAMTSGNAYLGGGATGSTGQSSTTSSSWQNPHATGDPHAYYQVQLEEYNQQINQARNFAIGINASRMQKIMNRMSTITFNNPFQDSSNSGFLSTGYSNWNKDKDKFNNVENNSDYSTLSTTSSQNSSESAFLSTGYVNYNSLQSQMKTSPKSDFTESDLANNNSDNKENDYLTEVADKTIDKTIDDLADQNVKARLKSIKEIGTESNDLLNKMIDDFFKPYSPELEEEIDRFFGTYESNVTNAFMKANSYIREQSEQIEGQISNVNNAYSAGQSFITNGIFSTYGSLRL